MEFKNEKPANLYLPDECQTDRGMFDDISGDRHFIDLRPILDDKTVIKNPHKGWFWHFVDNGMRAGAYRDRTPEGDFVEDFPGMNHLYLRFDWSDVEKEKGVYDFSPLDDIMDKWGPHGYRFSLRVCAFESSPEMAFATPKYIFEEGAQCFRTKYGTIQPDYGDPYFLERLEKFMKAFGKKYNGDPRIELIDVGTYGTWGEGHTVEGDGVIYPMDIIKKHFDLHAKYFPDTFVLCNDDHIIGRMAHGKGEVHEMLDYAYARGFGVQDDSICCDGYANDCGYDTMRAGFTFEKLSERAPSCIEFAHYTYIKPRYAEYFRNGYTIIECLKNSKATFAGFHGYPSSWLPNEGYLTEYCANRLGYWFFPTFASVDTLNDTAHNVIKLHIENKGWARAYWKTDLKVMLKGEGGEVVCTSDFDMRTIEPAAGADVNVKLDLRGLKAGDYDLAIGMQSGDDIVRFALKPETFDGKFNKIARVHVSEV